MVAVPTYFSFLEMVRDDQDAFLADLTFPSVDCRFLPDPFPEEKVEVSLSQTLEI